MDGFDVVMANAVNMASGHRDPDPDPGVNRAVGVTVILCTHNPRADYLSETLEGLRRQSMEQSEWEFLLIDNGSSDPLAETIDLSWHSRGRIVREEELGLTPARLRGYAESVGDLIVFVDDDNILSPDYLENARKIGVDRPYLGAWGGSITGIFETDPEPFWDGRMSLLAIREVERARWSNDPAHLSMQPFGAGLCIRRAVLRQYVEGVQSDGTRRGLGRRGSGLGGCEDLDMVMSCPDLGLGFGVFPELKMKHLIPAGRLQLDYLLRLYEGSSATHLVLKAARGMGGIPKQPTAAQRGIDWVRMLRKSKFDRLLRQAYWRAVDKARVLCKENGIVP